MNSAPNLERASRSVVMLCPIFPPSARVGGKRPARFVRYLRRFDWEPIVLSLPGGGGWIYEPELLTQLPPGVRLEPRYAEGHFWSWFQRQEDLTARLHGRTRDPKPNFTKRERFVFNLAWWLRQPLYRLAPIDYFSPYLFHAASQAVKLAREEHAKVIYACAHPFSVLPAGTWYSSVFFS